MGESSPPTNKARPGDLVSTLHSIVVSVTILGKNSGAGDPRSGTQAHALWTLAPVSPALNVGFPWNYQSQNQRKEGEQAGQKDKVDSWCGTPHK